MSEEQVEHNEWEPPEKASGVTGSTKILFAGLCIIALVLAVAAGVGGYFWGQHREQEVAQAERAVMTLPQPPAEVTAPHDLHRRVADDPFAIGNVDAPVVISYFSDFECPYCARFAQDVEPELVKKYVDTGKVRIEWNDFVVNGEHAYLAAQAGRAAAAQDKFDEFRKALYAASDPSSHPENDIDDLLGFARQAGVPDLDRFREEVTSGKYKQAVYAASALSGRLTTGTPTFIVGGEVLRDEPTLDNFSQLIDAQL